MSFLSAVQKNIGRGSKAEELEGEEEGEGNALKPREFLWDNIVLFVVSSILGLAAIDVVTEFLRGGLGGGGVACFPTSGADDAQAAYINNYCSSFLPYGAYVTTFMVVHAVLLIVPHYLWLGNYDGNFEYFFQLVSTLKRVQDHTQAGERIPENLVIVQQLETTFTLLGRKFIFRSYVIKLIIQFVWSLVGIIFGTGFFVTRFNVRFTCPPSTEDPFWPFDETVSCTYETLSLLQYLWIVDLLLLLLASVSLIGALLWSFSTHSPALGYKEFAKFAFESGFHWRYYIPPIPCSDCLHQCFTSLSCVSTSSPYVIKTDLDFLVLRLYQTDAGLGHVFVDELTQKQLKNHLDDDHRKLALHREKQYSAKANDELYGSVDHRRDLKWKFPKEIDAAGVYTDFVTFAQVDSRSNTTPPVVPDSMCGAVLGFAALAPKNDNAISISFGDSGYTLALARVFNWVAHLNFSPHYNNSEKATKVTRYFNKVVSIECAEDVLSSSSDIRTEFQEKLKCVWSPDNVRLYDTPYIVVGPIPEEKKFNLTNLHLFLESISGCLMKNAVLVCIQPQHIGGKVVRRKFLDYEPMKLRFNKYSVAIQKTGMESDWKARNVRPSPQPEDQRITETHAHFVNVTCGSLECQVKFSLYKYKYDPEITRPIIWKLSEEPASDSEESDEGERSVVHVSGKMKLKDLTKKKED